MYSMSLRLLGRISSMEETRDRVSVIVKRLKSRSLLLNGRDMNYVKMHDVVRDVAIVIAGKEGHTDPSPGNHSVVECEWIFMFLKASDEIHDHLEGSNYPKLGLLAMQQREEWWKPLVIEQLPSLDGMKKLRSLSFIGISIISLRQTIISMKNLLMLRLVNCNVECISIIGELLRLEIFVCSHCYEIKELPHEMRGLKRLRLLEFRDCSNLERIAPGIISNLTELEEFIMWESFKGWESIGIKHEERRNASLHELMSLTKLKLLWIHIENYHLVEQKVLLPPMIVNYRIFIGDQGSLTLGECLGRIPNCEKSLCLYGLPQHIIFENWIHKLVSTTEDLYLEGNGSRNFDVSEIDSNNIKFLKIRNDDRVEELIHSTTTSANWRSSSGVFPILESLKLDNLPALKNILYVGSVPERSISFKNLETLELERLPMLTSLWKLLNQNAEDAFLQLKMLAIYECERMEEVFYSDDSENEGTSSYGIIFPKLEKLFLEGLPSLLTFAKGIEYIQFPLLKWLKIRGCPKFTGIVSSNVSSILKDEKLQVTFGSLRWVTIPGHIFRNIWCSHTSHPSFGKIEDLELIDSESVIKSLYSSSIIPHFVNVKCLRIERCGTMEKLIASEVFFEIFPVLESMELDDLPKLEELWDTTISERSNALHNLTELNLTLLPALKHLYSNSNQWIPLNNLSAVYIYRCDKLRNLFSWKMPKDQVLRLENLDIMRCEMMEHIFSNEEKGASCHITFSRLKTFQFYDLKSLTTLFDGVESIDFPMLEQMNIGHCLNPISIIPFIGCNQNGVTDGHGDDSFHCFCCPKVRFGSLRRLTIRDWNKMSNVWCHRILPGFFQGLEKLSIVGCGGVKILFSSQIAENLVSLKELRIESCNQMEKVIDDVGKVQENSTLFPSLVHLNLKNLHSFKMFCEWKCSVMMPTLRSTHIEKCPMMEFFNTGSLRGPELKHIQLDGKPIEVEESDKMEDLNSYIHYHLIKSTRMESTSNEIMEEKEQDSI